MVRLTFASAITTFFSRVAPARRYRFCEVLELHTSMPWAFNVPRGKLAKFWDQIPCGLDILVTHGPAHRILDQSIPPGIPRLARWEDEELSGGSDHLGCEELLAAVNLTKPRVHLFGHIHSGYGARQNKCTKFHHASLCDEAYNPTNELWVIET
jgi:Icc-related predicted phosphoesterase